MSATVRTKIIHDTKNPYPCEYCNEIIPINSKAVCALYRVDLQSHVAKYSHEICHYEVNYEP